MIVQITGNVKYSITLDPTVWIFDDRKILFEDAFANSHFNHDKTNLNKVADRWSQEVFQQKGKPPVNKTINRFQKEKVLNHSYVMPIKEFLSHAEVNPDATDATLQTTKGNVNITLKELQNSLVLFAIKGKPIKDDGPVHIYFKDGSNKSEPIKGVKEIIIN